jgi:hypothetical protein
MNNSLETEINIVSLRKQLHAVASNVPAIDPFSKLGVIEWGQWSETCRNIESELRDAGECL